VLAQRGEDLRALARQDLDAVAAAVGVDGDERLARVVEGDALDGVLLDGVEELR